MQKFANDIEKNMAAILMGNVDKLSLEEGAIEHLSKAQNILANAGFEKEATIVSHLLISYASIDDQIKSDLIEESYNVEVDEFPDLSGVL
jgi:hypothetical protein